MITAKIKTGALCIALCAGLTACDALQITGGPLEMGAANSGNLLSGGGFEGGFGNWRACSDPTTVTLTSNETRTQSSAQLAAGGCLYQIVPAQTNDNMLVNCSARKAGNNWASITFGYLDENYQPLNSVEAPIPDSNFTTVSTSLRAPDATAYAEILVYAEDGAALDDCEMINMQDGLPTELMLNPYFEEGLNGWQTCSRGSTSVENNTATITESCITQKFTASEGIELSVTCDGTSTGDDYAALALGYLDADFQPVEMIETPLATEAGDYTVATLTAPATTSYVQVMVYTEGEARLNSCSLQAVEANEGT